MKDTELHNLRTHAEQLALSMMLEAGPDGIIRTSNVDGAVSVDVPATHHLVELLARLDPAVFADGISSAMLWLLDPDNGYSNHPFALDSLTRIRPHASTQEDMLRSGIAEHQLKDGSIPVFTAYLHGGDYFSTLWSVKILCQYSRKVFESEIDLAFDYLIKRRSVGCTSLSQLGFLGLLLAKYVPEHTKLLQEIAGLIENEIESSNTNASLLLVDRLFLLEDLMMIDSVVGGYRDTIDDVLVGLFELSKTPEGIPQSIMSVRPHFSESLFLESIARAAIVGIQRCEAAGEVDIAYSVNRLVHSDYRNTRYKALQTSARLRAFLERYGSIHEAFSVYNTTLEKIWDKQAFDKTVFLMMPFETDIEYRKLTEVIKAECQRWGYRAIRVDDADRIYSDRLWDNLIINMLSAKYGIAVYVSEPVVDRLKKDEVRLFSNPNVALEFGFFKSRGQDVLLLKDKNSKLPADLQGFLWSEFDIKNPDMTVPKKIEIWLRGIQGLLDNE